MKRRTILQTFIAGIVAFFTPVKTALPALAEPKFMGYSGTRSPGDVFTMIWEICQHVKATGDEILSADDPQKRTIGYVAIASNGERVVEWVVPLTRVIERPSIGMSQTPLEWRTGPTAKAREQITREYIKTPAGRAKLAESFTSAGRRFRRCRTSSWTDVQFSKAS